MTLTEIVAKVDTGAEKRAAEALNKRDAYDVLIVGSGPAGAAAAVYSARKGIRTGLMGERFGGQVLDTVDIENYISVPKTEGQKLAGALKAHVSDTTLTLSTARAQVNWFRPRQKAACIRLKRRPAQY